MEAQMKKKATIQIPPVELKQMDKQTGIDLTLLLTGANPGSVLRTVWGELMRKLGAMQFGCCFTRFQLGALSHTPYVGKDAGKGVTLEG